MPTGVFMLLFLCSCFFNAAFSQNIVERPKHQTVREGQTVLFRCIIRNLMLNQNVYWSRVSPRQFISQNRMLLNSPQRDRLAILGNGNLGEFFLQIRNVQLSDAGAYRCGYAVPNMQFTFAQVELTVHRPPNEGSPTCEFSPNGLRIDDVATLTCRSEGGQPPASLTWRLGDLPITDPKESRNVLSVVVSGDHNGREFVCDATSPAFDVPRWCSVVLISIRPDVRVEPPLGIGAVGERIVFTCVAFGLPAIVRYEWLFDNEPVDYIQRIQVSLDGRTLIINNIELYDDETPVSCTATTTYGLSATSGALLRVEDATTVTLEPTMNMTGFYNDTMGGQNGKPSGIIIAIIVIAVILGQALFIFLVYVLHRFANRMMKERKAARRRPTPVVKDMNERHSRPVTMKETDMGENIYVGGVSMGDRDDIDPETGTPKVYYNSIDDSSFDSSFSMGEGVYSQGPTTPPTGMFVSGPLATLPENEGDEETHPTPPSSPLYINPVELDQEKQEVQGRRPPPSAPAISPSSISESAYGYDEVPYVEAVEEPRRPPPPTTTPPRPPVVITSPPPNKPPPRAPADKRQSNPKGRVPPNTEYCGLNPDRPESRYLSLCHYDEAYADEVLNEGAKLSGGEEYCPYDHPVTDPDDEHHDDDGYIYELPPATSSPDELYDVPPDAAKREYTFMGSNVPPKV